MNYDLSVLHPIHRKNFEDFLNSEFKNSLTPDGRLARDVLYEQYVDLNDTVPDIIGKTEDQMTDSQKQRLEAKVAEIAENRPGMPPQEEA